MEEHKKSNYEKRIENDRSEEKPNEEGTVDGEEGTGSTDIKDNKDDGKEEPVRKSKIGGVEREMSGDKVKTDGTVNEVKVEVKKADDGKRVKTKDKGGKGDYKNKDIKELEEDKVFKDTTVKWNGSKNSKQELQVANGKTYETEVKEVGVNLGEEGLKLSVEVLQSEEGNVQLKATRDQTASISKQDSPTKKQESYKHAAAYEIKLENGEAIYGQSSSHIMPSKEQNKKVNEVLKNVEAIVDKTQQQDDTEETMQRATGDHQKDQKEDMKISDNMNKELNKEETVIEMKEEEENTVIKTDTKTNDDRTVSVHQKPVQEIKVVEGSVNTFLLSSTIHQIPQKKAKEREKLSVTEEGKQGMEVNVTQKKKWENKVQEMSSGEIIKNSLQYETVAGKEEHHKKASEKEKNESDNKIKNQTSMKDLNDTEKGRKEENEEQKDVNGDKRVSDLSDNKTNVVIKEVTESPSLKAANKVAEDTQQKHSAEECTSEEKPIKSKKEHTSQSTEIPASTLTLPSKISDQNDQSQGVHCRTHDMSTTEKPIHTVFQVTVSRGAECEESVQREESVQQSDVSYSKQSQEDNIIKSGNSLTETAINDQLQQLERQIQSPEQKTAHLKQQPLKQQAQQMQQKQNQQLREQTEMQPKLQHPQKQIEQKQHQQQKLPEEQMEQEKQEQQTQKGQQKEWKEQTQQKQQQIQQPQKKKTKVNQIQEEKQSVQKNQQQSQQQSMVREQEIQKQKPEEQVKQKQQQRQEQGSKKKEHKTKKQEQQQTKEEYMERQQWQQEQKFGLQKLQSYEQEKERNSEGQHQKDQGNQANKQEQQQPLEQSEQNTVQQNQSKWQQQQHQEQPKKQQKPKEQQEKLKQQQEQLKRKQEPEQLTQQEKKEKTKEQQKQEPNHDQQEQPEQTSQEGEEDSAPGCGGMQGRNCPIYFGVKSYLHHFYDSAPVKNSQLYEDYTEVSHSLACRIR